MILRLLLISILLSIASLSVAQNNELASPIDGPLKLSGTFGEIRGNHFHTGIDIKTGGKTGLPVYSVSDGHVVRVKVETGGYGKAVYIAHPNGTTSVYAHLSDFEPELKAWVKKQQYANKSFTVDLNPAANKFEFKKGELIAYSGNSGGSGAPHLHFEIRNSGNQHPTNVAKCGLSILDQKPPELKTLAIYAHGNSGAISNSFNRKKYLTVKPNGEGWSISDGSTIEAIGLISFGIGVIDRLSLANNPCGIYSIELSVNNQPFYGFSLDELNFSTKRYVNAHIDFRYKKENRIPIHRTYRAPNNKLKIYHALPSPKGGIDHAALAPSMLENRGMLLVEPGKKYQMKYTVTDHFGNVSQLDFTVIGSNINRKNDRLKKPSAVFLPSTKNNFTADGLRFNTPTLAVYDTLNFEYSQKPAGSNCAAKIHSLCDLGTPLHKFCTLSIKVNPKFNKWSNKLLIVSYDKKGNPVAEGGTYKNGWMTTRTRSFGNYTVMLDTITPNITQRQPKKLYTLGDTLGFNIEEELSGISSISAMLNSQWILLEWDPKNDHAYYVIDEHTNVGSNRFVITAIDEVGNKTEKVVSVLR